jgi:hypothetical protein
VQKRHTRIIIEDTRTKEMVVKTRGRATTKTDSEKSSAKNKSRSPAAPAKAKATKKTAKNTPKKEPVEVTDDVAKTESKPQVAAPAETARTPPASAKKKATTPKSEKAENTSTPAAVDKAASPARGKAASPIMSAPEPSLTEDHKDFHYEFGGPIGAFFVITSLPLVIYGLYFICHADHCVRNPLTEDWMGIFNRIPPVSEWLTDLGFAMCTGWLVFQYVLERILPGALTLTTSLQTPVNCLLTSLHFIFLPHIYFFFLQASLPMVWFYPTRGA